MADQAKVGTDWGDDELDAIVADYFAMLAAERAGEAYVKSHHSAALMERIGRTHRSVEFKHMNISAVLHRAHRPTIRGYKPKFNFQNAIIDAIDRHLSPSLGLSDSEPVVVAGLAEAQSLFEEPPPTPDFNPVPTTERLERLLRKLDYTERDFKNRALGKAGEELIIDFERRRLAEVERRDLARKVRWVSQEDGDGAGYDILSFDRSGRERLIEVKTTRGTRKTPFFLTSNERSFADERPEAFRLYRVYEYGEAPRFFKLRPPLQQAVVLEPVTYRASFG